MSRTQDAYLSEVLRLEQPLRAILHRFAPQPADLDDLLQETYCRLFSLAADRRAEIRNLQAFSITTARNVAMDWIRRRRVVNIETVEDFGDLPVPDDSAGLEEMVHTHQQLVRIAAGVAQLSDSCREVFILHRVYGLTQSEIAAQMGTTEGAVEQQLVRGLKRCINLLKGDDVRKSAPEIKRNGLFGRLRKRMQTTEKQG